MDLVVLDIDHIGQLNIQGVLSLLLNMFLY